jgi:hypothetical protein
VSEKTKTRIQRKSKHRNDIRFNCKAYERLFYVRPDNCYNCMMRDGYPQNLGGDENCQNYSPKDTTEAQDE